MALRTSNLVGAWPQRSVSSATNLATSGPTSSFW